MAYTLPAVSYGNGKINGTHGCETEPPRLPSAPSMAPVALSEALVSQVEADLRLALVDTQVSCLEERLSHLEAELAGLLRDPCGDDSPSDNQSAPLL
jgi:hypothetical protein